MGLQVMGLFPTKNSVCIKVADKIQCDRLLEAIKRDDSFRIKLKYDNQTKNSRKLFYYKFQI